MSMLCHLECVRVRAYLIIFFCGLSLPSLATAQVVTELVKDINQQPIDIEFCGGSSLFPGSGSFNGEYYICINSLSEGQEPWVSDGTLAGTRILKDIAPGSAPGNPRSFYEFQNKLYFSANGGSGLWNTDGTTQGTVDLEYRNPGSGDGAATNFTDNDEELFFTTGGSKVKRLYKTDGTELGSELLAEFGGSSTQLVILRGVAPVGNDLYLFQLNIDTNGTRSDLLAYYDGDADSFVNLSTQHVVEEAIGFDGKYFFRGYEVSNEDRELWVSDGTLAGTVVFKELVEIEGGEGRPGNFNVVGDTLFFSARTEGSQLWISDGTSEGTVPVVPSDGLGLFNLEEMIALDDKVIFLAERGGSGLEIWVSDGSGAGTFLLKDINPGSTGSIPASFDKRLVRSGNFVYFEADDGIHGKELWRTDGTTIGTILVKDIVLGPADGNLVLVHGQDVDGELFFVANDGSGQTVWKTDGTANGTVEIPLANGGTNGSEPESLSRIGDEVYFSADNGIVGREPWISDGTEQGTRLLKDIAEEGGSVNFSRARNFTRFAGMVYFSANGNNNDGDPWISDGTEENTRQLADIAMGPDSSSGPSNFTALGSQLVFTASDGANGIELWKTDGSEVGTEIVKDINPLVIDDFPESSFPSLLTPLGEDLLFLADDGVHGFELWKTDGTNGGTELVKDILPGINGAFSQSFDQGVLFFSEPLVVLGGRVFFPALDDQFGTELWTSDGTAAGTQLLADINPNGNARPRDMIEFQGQLFFAAINDSTGDELWSSDGTTAGTKLLKDIQSGTGSSQPRELIEAKGKFFFAADDGVHGRELFVSQGTAASTKLVKDIIAGATGSQPTNLTAAGDFVLFTITDEQGRVKLWHSDGTSEGTQATKEFRAGQTDESLDNFLAIDNVVYYTVDDGLRGIELYRTEFPLSDEELCVPIVAENQNIALICL